MAEMKSKCCNAPLVKRNVPPHVGIYCSQCGKWQQWVGKKDVTFAEVPFEDFMPRAKKDKVANQQFGVIGRGIKTIVIDDPRPTDKLPWED